MSKFTAKPTKRPKPTSHFVTIYFPSKDIDKVRDYLEDWAMEVETNKGSLLRQIVTHALKDAGYDI